MEDQHFDEPVKILTGKARSVIRQVSTIAEAAQHRLYNWPVQGGSKKPGAMAGLCVV